MSYSFTQPCCHKCWPAYAKSVGKEGTEPVALIPEARTWEMCCFCGFDTLRGIYVRVDPAKVEYPTKEVQ
jgi:hypothetical protein